MMGFADSTLFMKIAMGLSLAGSVFDLIGLAAPHWLTHSGGTHTLLFQSCKSYGGVSSCQSLFGAALSNRVRAIQALNVIGFWAGWASTVLINLYIFFWNKKIVRLLALVCAFGAGGFILIGVIVVGTHENVGTYFSIGYAMIMAIIAALIFIGTGAVVVVDVVKSPPPPSQISEIVY